MFKNILLASCEAILRVFNHYVIFHMSYWGRVISALDFLGNCCIKQHLAWVFFFFWKRKGNIVPIHKKVGKQKLKYCRPVSLLPICGKILENLLLKERFKFFIENKLISSNQSGYKLWQFLHYSTVIYHSWDIWESFDVGL